MYLHLILKMDLNAVFEHPQYGISMHLLTSIYSSYGFKYAQESIIIQANKYFYYSCLYKS